MQNPRNYITHNVDKQLSPFYKAMATVLMRHNEIIILDEKTIKNKPKFPIELTRNEFDYLKRWHPIHYQAVVESLITGECVLVNKIIDETTKTTIQNLNRPHIERYPKVKV